MSAEELRRRHVTVVLALVPHLASLRADFEDAVVNEFPEFTKHPRIDEVVRDVGPGTTARYGIGGTSFLGHPSVFHSPTLRRLRREVFRTLLIEVFGDYLAGRPDLGVELLLDRIMIRPPGDQPPKESWHRDVSPWCRAGEEVFGGWLNLDERPQYFSCLPGSASPTSLPGSASPTSLPGSTVAKGFVPEVAPGEGEVIEVPPGGLVLFREDILHEVVATKLKYTSVRLFHGFKVSPALGTSSLPDITEVLTTQAVPLIKSGQLPVAYPQSAVRFLLQAERVSRWREEMLTDPEGAIDPKTRAFRPLAPRALSKSHPRAVVASHPRALSKSHPRWTKKEASSLKVSRVFFLPDRQGVSHKLTLVP